MNLKPLAIALVTGCLTLSQLAYSAPTDIEVIDNIDRKLITKINTDENDITHVTVAVDGTSHDMSFTAQELSDKQSVKQRISELPKDVQKPVLRMLERVQLHAASPRQPLDPKVEQAIKIKLEKLHQQLSGKEAEIEAHAFKLESKAREIEEKARELEVIFEQNEGQFEIHMDSLGDDIEILTEQITELELERLGLDGDASRVLIIQGHGKPTSSDILELIERAELTDEQKQKLSEVLAQK
ncbi:MULTISPECIES: hypothetical protein [unclassified Shewanella]|uniref:hypothetical protein n=1 Tax=unclassified Shewanella TaxID=196818 RepID=UPI001BC78244|nr:MULTISPECIES: hypothetical protein [unclassified Shewanella]GIU08102.1 hypothetical protein TUM4444_08630 [Shewanella sp. MBTL60-112-B1]GIU40687.1 hypothetical protein TUM4445_40360 [Shewanella sp. MBTL60-112-B2]